MTEQVLFSFVNIISNNLPAHIFTSLHYISSSLHVDFSFVRLAESNRYANWIRCSGIVSTNIISKIKINKEILYVNTFFKTNQNISTSWPYFCFRFSCFDPYSSGNTFRRQPLSFPEHSSGQCKQPAGRDLQHCKLFCRSTILECKLQPWLVIRFDLRWYCCEVPVLLYQHRIGLLLRIW